MWTQQAVGGLPSEDQHCDVDTAGCCGHRRLLGDQVRINTAMWTQQGCRGISQVRINTAMWTQQAVGGLPSEDQHCDVDTAGCWGITK